MSHAESSNNCEQALAERIHNRTAVVGVVGLGYVGLPLLLEFYKAGFPVRGLDVDEEKIDALAKGQSYILHIPAGGIASMASSGRYQGTTNMAASAECDVIVMCVPTPLSHHREPDISYIEKTCQAIGPHVRPGQLLILESTTYPGTTDEVVVPILENLSGLRSGHDFFVAYSPEREDPSNKSFSTSTIPKVVGASSAPACRVACALYDTVIVRTVPVSSAAAAEATKLVENIFRSVNIAMVNELKVVFQKMGIDIWEVIEAAKTKPFGFMPFYPGPGLGGHCIPIDPFYLTWKAREYDIATKFIELAGEVNTAMPNYVVTRTMEALNNAGKAMKGSHILILGLAYKANVDDMRESPTFKLMELYEERGAIVHYHDPYIPEIRPTREHADYTGRQSVPLEFAADCDLIVISTAHDCVDYAKIGEIAPIIVDTRNAMAAIPATRAQVYKA